MKHYGHEQQFPLKSHANDIPDMSCHVMWVFIGVSVDALCRDGAGQISREGLQRGLLTRQRTTS